MSYVKFISLILMMILIDSGFGTLSQDTERLVPQTSQNGVSVELSPGLSEESIQQRNSCRSSVARCALNSARNCGNCLLHYIIYAGIFAFGFGAAYITILKFKQS